MQKFNDSFVFFESWWEILEDERQEVQWEVIHAIMEYVFRGNLVELKPNSSMAFKFIKRDIDRSKENYAQFIQKQSSNGSKGGAKVGNQNARKTTQNNPKQPKTTQTSLKEKENVKDKDINILFKNIDIVSFLDSTELNKKYVLIAFRFWELWIKEYPNAQHLKTAKVYDWYDSVRLIIEHDKQDFDRLVGIYLYFKNCAENTAGYDRFWFETIKSVKSFRKKDREDVFYIDKIIDKVNTQLAKNEEFNKQFDNLKAKINESIKLS